MSDVRRDRAPPGWEDARSPVSLDGSSPYRASDRQGLLPSPRLPPQVCYLLHGCLLSKLLSPRPKWSVERHTFLLPGQLHRASLPPRAVSSLHPAILPLTRQLSLFYPRVGHPVGLTPFHLGRVFPVLLTVGVGMLALVCLGVSTTLRGGSCQARQSCRGCE